MTERRCAFPDCTAEPRPTGPEFCEPHWQQLPKERRKFICKEHAMGGGVGVGPDGNGKVTTQSWPRL